MQHSLPNQKRTPNVLRKKPPRTRTQSDEGVPQHRFVTLSIPSLEDSVQSTQPHALTVQPRYANQTVRSRFIEVVDPPPLPTKDPPKHDEGEWKNDAMLQLEWLDRPATPDPSASRPTPRRVRTTEPRPRPKAREGSSSKTPIPITLGGAAKPIPFRVQTTPTTLVYPNTDHPRVEKPPPKLDRPRAESTPRPHRHHRSKTVHGSGVEEPESPRERKEKARAKEMEDKWKKSSGRYPQDPTKRAEIMAWQTNVTAAGGPAEKPRREQSRYARP